jgi:hypothetical protein
MFHFHLKKISKTDYTITLEKQTSLAPRDHLKAGSFGLANVDRGSIAPNTSGSSQHESWLETVIKGFLVYWLIWIK